MKKLLTTVAMLAALAGNANAAEISAKKMGKNHVVIVKSDIEVGDYETFKRVASKLPSGSTLVAFNSDGGAAIDGMNMGLLIRQLRFATYVPSDAVCASVCALAWLAGTPRYVTSS